MSRRPDMLRRAINHLEAEERHAREARLPNYAEELRSKLTILRSADPNTVNLAEVLA